MPIQEFDGRTPKLVTRLFQYSRKFPYDSSKGIDEDNACRHDIFTFRDRPGWTIDAYQYGILGLSTEFLCRVTTPWRQVEYCWFKSGLEFDEWTGSLTHSFKWEETDECKDNTIIKIADDGREWRFPPPAPQYIERCSCLTCNKEEYDGLEWKVGEEIDRLTNEQKKDADAMWKTILDVFKGVPMSRISERESM